MRVPTNRDDRYARNDRNCDLLTYIIVLDHPVGRLKGTSDILYIGQTERLGSVKSCRLWNYKNETTLREKRIVQRVQELVNEGHSVNLHVCYEPPDGKSVEDYERDLLEHYDEEHWELPPWNHQRGSGVKT